MTTFKRTKKLAAAVGAAALALFLAAIFSACYDGTSIIWPITPDEDYEHSASEMTQTQSSVATSQPITVDPTTKTLVLTGLAAGKTIYMARTNPSNKEISATQSRIAEISSNVSASASKSLEEFSGALAEGFASGFGFDGTNDPHKKIYDAFLKNLEEAKNAKVSKSLASPAIQAAAKNYALGKTEEFWALNPKTLNSFYKRTFKLLASGDNYNVWVDVNDKYYKEDTSAFETAARELGTNFINGYGLVSHLYGEPADKIYSATTGQEYGDMATVSRTGLKINITLYNMLEIGKVYGFVYHGDVYHFEGGSDEKRGSNEGRFVYIDSQTTKKQPLEAKSTAQHEFSHTISKNQKALHGKEWTYWYGELLAMMCEDMMQDYLGIRDDDVNTAKSGLACTPKGRLPQANALASFNGISGEDSLAYASVFQFGAWLSRNFGGAKFLKELSQNAYVDMESVLKAVNAMGGAQYTQASLLQKFAGDLLKAENGEGLNKAAATYRGDPAYTCDYTDSDGLQQTYDYPITAINLWDPFYAWCYTSAAKSSPSDGVNTRVSFSSLPGANLYKATDWKGKTPPEDAYLGPLMFNNGKFVKKIGPYGSLLFNLGTATGGSATINFACAGNGFSDVITIYVK